MSQKKAKAERRAEREAAREPKFCPACKFKMKQSEFPKHTPPGLRPDFYCLNPECGQKWTIRKNWPSSKELKIMPPLLKSVLAELKEAGWTLTEADHGEYCEAVLTHKNGQVLKGQGRIPHEAEEAVVGKAVRMQEAAEDMAAFERAHPTLQVTG